jgi:chromosome segregation ATPase
MHSKQIEEFATSKKRIELATQHDADQAEISALTEIQNHLVQAISVPSNGSKHVSTIKSSIGKTLAKLNKIKSKSNNSKVLEVLDDLEDIKSEYVDVSLTQIKKEERHKRSTERQARKQAKIDNMSPESRKSYEEKQKQRQEKRDYMKSLTKEERKLERIKNMTSKQLTKHQEKKAQKEAFNQLSPEEQLKIKLEKKAKAQERKAQYQHLKENWSLELPDDIEHLIIDGNNMRGGGPRRHSRDVIMRHIKETKDIVPQLTNVNVTVYFDHKPAKYEPIDGFEVKFSGDIIADDMIVEDVSKSEKKTLVITSDRLLAVRLLELNAYVMRNGVFGKNNPNAPGNPYRKK